MTPNEGRVPVKMLDRKSADWTLYHDTWASIDLLYEGATRLKNNVDRFLLKRPKELSDVYQERARQLTYQNLLRNCVGWYLAKMFQKEPQIEGPKKNANFEGFLQDCDHAGTTFSDFARRILEGMILYKRAFVLMDKPKPGEQPIATRADEIAQGLDQPYVQMFDPVSVFNWSTDAYGNLKWIVIKAIEFKQDDPLGGIEVSAHWYVYDTKTVRHYKYTKPEEDQTDEVTFFRDSCMNQPEAVTAELINDRPHVLATQGRVPVRICEVPLSLWFTNGSYLHLVEHLNVLNGFAWKLFMCNHPQLVIQTEGEVGGKTLSEVGYLRLAVEDKIQYLSPGAETFEVSQKYLDTMREEIYRGFHLQAQAKQSTATADGASGFSKEMEMAPAIDILNALGDVERAAMQLVLTDYADAAGNVDAKAINVNGFRFETKPLTSDIAVTQAMDDLGLLETSPTLEKVCLKRIASSAVDGEDEATKTTVMKEIDEAPSRQEAAELEQKQQQQMFTQQLQKATAKGTVAAEQGSLAA